MPFWSTVADSDGHTCEPSFNIRHFTRSMTSSASPTPCGIMKKASSSTVTASRRFRSLQLPEPTSMSPGAVVCRGNMNDPLCNTFSSVTLPMSRVRPVPSLGTTRKYTRDNACLKLILT